MPDVFAIGDCCGYLESTGKSTLPALAQVSAPPVCTFASWGSSRKQYTLDPTSVWDLLGLFGMVWFGLVYPTRGPHLCVGFTGSFGFGLSYPWTLPTSVWDILDTFGLI